MKLNDIPYVNIGTQGFDCLADSHADSFKILVDEARKGYTIVGLKTADFLARKWAGKTAHVSYRDEIEKIAAKLGTGVWLLNLGYEFGCTTAAVPFNPNPRLLRVLDWDMPGLGKTVMAVERHSNAGKWMNFTWPGFTGVIQAVAPGRFAIAINHAPQADTKCGWLVDWVAGKVKIWRRDDTPPSQLLRYVFEECKTFEEAKFWLTNSNVCSPVFYTLVGCNPNETALIERLPETAIVHEGLTAVSNHWLNDKFPGASHSSYTDARLEMMKYNLTKYGGYPNPFSWASFPVVNEITRLVLEANPATGEIVAYGVEDGRRATKVLRLTI